MTRTYAWIGLAVSAAVWAVCLYGLWYSYTLFASLAWFALWLVSFAGAVAAIVVLIRAK